MEQIFGLVLIHQLQEDLKTPVGIVIGVTDTLGRRVGHDDIHTAGLAELQPKLADPAAHILLRILVRAGVIPNAAAQTQDPHAVIGDHLAVNTVATLGIALGIVGIMVAVDKQYRASCHGHQKGQIVGF